MMKKEKENKKGDGIKRDQKIKKRKKKVPSAFPSSRRRRFPYSIEIIIFTVLALASIIISPSFILFKNKTDFPHHDPCPLHYS